MLAKSLEELLSLKAEAAPLTEEVRAGMVKQHRRSQRLSFNWAGFNQMWKTLAIPNPQIVEKPYQRNDTWKLSYR